MAAEFPSFLKLEYRRDQASLSAFNRDLDAALDGGKAKFEEFGREAQRQVDAALSVNRNSFGSLDLGVDQLKAAAAAQQARAVAARELASATELAARAAGDESREAMLAIKALNDLAREEERVARAAMSHARASEQVQQQLNLQKSATDALIRKNGELERSYPPPPPVDLRDPTIRAAVGDASIDRAALSGATLESVLGRVNQKSAQFQRELSEYTASAARLMATIDPMVAAQQRFDATLAEAKRLLDANAISTEEYARAQTHAKGQLDATRDSVSGVAQAQREALHIQQAAEVAQKEMTASAAQLRAQLDPMFAAQQRFDAELVRADKLLEAGAISTREYAQAQQLARDNLRESARAIMQQGVVLDRQAKVGTTARGNVINSVRAERTAFIQLGQQMQDMTVQAQMGTNAFLIFGQQMPQVAFALSGLSESANKTKAAIGGVATFMSGPWGAAVFTATALLGPFIYNLIAGGDAADDLNKKSLSLSEALRDYEKATDSARKALAEYNQEQDRARDGADRMIRINLALAESHLKSAITKREETRALLESYDAQLRNPIVAGQGGPAIITARRQVEGIASAQTSAIAELEEAIRNLRIEDAQRTAEAAVDPIAAINQQYDDMANLAKRAAAGNNLLSRSLTDVLTKLERQRKAALDLQRAQDRAKRPRAERAQPVTVSEVAGLLGATKYGGTRSPARNKEVGGSANSYHLAGQAIDIPLTVNGKPMTKEGIRAALEPAGVIIKELLGPGDKNHDDHFHVAFDKRRGSATSIIEASKRDAEALEQFAGKATESIARLNERFNEQPRLIDQAAAATRELDRIMAELSEREPAGFEQMIADAEEAKDVIEDALVRPFRQLAEESERRMQIDRLILSGREEEAEVLQTIWQIEQQLGPLKAGQRAEIEGIIRAESAHLELMERAREMQAAYLSATQSIRQELEGIFTGEFSFKNLGKIFLNLQAKVLTEQIFGDTLRDLERYVRQETGITKSVDIFTGQTERAGDASATLADSLYAAASRIAGAGSSLEQQFDAVLGGGTAGGATGASSSVPANDNTIVVEGIPQSRESLLAMSPERYFDTMSKRLMEPLLSGLDELLGTKFFGQLQGALSGALSGFVTGGAAGGVLGGVKGLLDGLIDTGDLKGQLIKDISGALGTGLKGAQTGTLFNAIFGGNKSGSQIGGAIGGMAGSILGPIGSIIGSILGSAIGSLFGGSDYGTASVRNGQIGLTSDKAEYRQAASQAGNALTDAIDQIAEQLGANVGSYAVSIGMEDGNWRVSSTGRSGKLKKKYGDVRDFGEGQAAGEAAMVAAIADAIRDGAIIGLGAAQQRLLQNNSGDLDMAIEKIKTFNSVFEELAQIRDPLGFEIDKLDKEFDRLRDIFEEAGATAAEYADLQELYEHKRAALIDEVTRRVTGSLQDLYDQLTIGDSGLSLRERLGNARTEYDALAQRVRAGDTTAFDDYAAAAKTMLDLQRQIYGSTSAYFTAFDEVRNLTGSTLDQQRRLIEEASGNQTFDPRNNIANDNQGVVSAIDRLGNTIVLGLGGKLDATNQNLGALLRSSNGGTGGRSSNRLGLLRANESW